jgi:hypothetical protein
MRKYYIESRGEEYPAFNKKKEGYLGCSHLEWELSYKTGY